ncbi:hypothetical protein [Lentzea sp. CA-135723]|uniref:hypothetical protein n=1 Tax=Lentzea sp. CA-135723 TaxID=3239950 RepID=UPI003D935CB2
MEPSGLKAVLGEQPWVAEMLAQVFDFDVSRGDEVGGLETSSGWVLRPIAGDLAGGSFFLCGPAEFGDAVVYVSSEGQAGVISGSLQEALELIVGLPCWQDCLTFSGDGDAAVMAAAARYSMKEFVARNPELPVLQRRISDTLSLEVLGASELVDRLHGAVASTQPDYAISDEDGEYETLFGSFRPERNPKWR